MVKTRAQDCYRDRDLYSSFESLGLRYLIQFGMEKDSRTRNVVRDDSVTNTRRICVSNLALSVGPVAKGSGELKSHQIKDVDHVVQRPRAVLSSPDNDHLIGEINKKAFKRGSNSKTQGGRFNLARVDAEKTNIKICETFNKQNRSKIKGYTTSPILKDKPCHTKLKY